jgi:hypothetical protein
MATKADKEIRVEFISICSTSIIEFPNIIATCAFNIIISKYSCKPGTVYPNIIKDHYGNLEMEHGYFTPPYLWEDLQSIEDADKVVTWLLAMPISNNEFEFLKNNGSDALEDLLEKTVLISSI